MVEVNTTKSLRMNSVKKRTQSEGKAEDWIMKKLNNYMGVEEEDPTKEMKNDRQEKNQDKG